MLDDILYIFYVSTARLSCATALSMCLVIAVCVQKQSAATVAAQVRQSSPSADAGQKYNVVLMPATHPHSSITHVDSSHGYV
jgi:hypothetical protein